MGFLANPIIALFLLSFTTTFYVSLYQINGEVDERKLQTYIIQVRQPQNPLFSKSRHLHSYYKSFLQQTGDASATSRIVYHYSDAITGFAAKLTEAEVEAMKKKSGFIKAFPDRIVGLLTTHTPAFLGLQGVNGLWKRETTLGRGVIIGMLDEGVFPNHPSFSDHGMEEVPSRWKGPCLFKEPYRCNKKLIGGRGFDFEGRPWPPVDKLGHGTHTASIAAGNFVTNASVLGNGNGTAAGMAPRAHIAAYKVCSMDSCNSSVVLAGIDAAIKDGVDIISLSLGGEEHDYTEDLIAIGAFSAMEKGIFVSCAAGNRGPKGTLDNEAPWVLTVGASTVDRRFRVTVKLGDGKQLHGESLYQPNNFTTEMMPLIVPLKKSTYSNVSNCEDPFMDEKLVKGKIVVCYKPTNDDGVGIGLSMYLKDKGAAGMIYVNDELDGYTTIAEAHVLPASHISYNDGRKLSNYLRKEHNPTATFIFSGTVLINGSAISVASFSSRGPNLASSNILKPDVIGPGVSVLAGWPIESYETDGLNFNIISGTSMSTPHLSGIAALIKSKHPDWSPAAIKSAIMTTSDIKSHNGKPITNEQNKRASYYMKGSGHVNPLKAMDPGLVYDLGKKDYISFLCGLGYSGHQMEVITRKKVNCRSIEKTEQSQLNYPSIAVSFQKSEKVTVKRTVTYVGIGVQKFTVKTKTEKGFRVIVNPQIMEFSKRNETKSFMVTLTRTAGGKDGAEGELSWISNKYTVRSPIIVTKYKR